MKLSNKIKLVVSFLERGGLKMKAKENEYEIRRRFAWLPTTIPYRKTIVWLEFYTQSWNTRYCERGYAMTRDLED